jgi:hypothetical protein
MRSSKAMQSSQHRLCVLPSAWRNSGARLSSQRRLAKVGFKCARAGHLTPAVASSATERNGTLPRIVAASERAGGGGGGEPGVDNDLEIAQGHEPGPVLPACRICRGGGAVAQRDVRAARRLEPLSDNDALFLPAYTIENCLTGRSSSSRF